MMTTTVTVIRITPLSAAAAPKNAYVPGVMQGISGWHTANMPDFRFALSTSEQIKVKFSLDDYILPQRFDDNPDHSTERCANGHGRNEDTTWNLASVRNYDQTNSDDRSDE